MTTRWFADRLTLFRLLVTHPQWSLAMLAAAVGRSVAWVKKWKARFAHCPLDDVAAARRAAAPRRPASAWAPAVITRILELRDTLPATLHRVPGPKAILYYLHRDPALADHRLPTSTRTIWRILRQHQRILDPPHRRHQPRERPAPLAEIELDFVDVTTIPSEPDGKRQHAAECLNLVDRGTSIPVASRVRADFTAATTIMTLAQILAEVGVPPLVCFDRDSRLMGAPSMRDFPAPFVQFLHGLGIAPVPCPPHTPQDKPYVERFNRTLTEECLRPSHPTTVAEAQEAVDAYRTRYIHERPHQGDACQNQPPAVAFPALPVLPGLPAAVDADAWLRAIDGRRYERRIDAHGSIQVAMHGYYVSQQLAGQTVSVQVDAGPQELVIWQGEQAIKRVAIKGLVGAVLPFWTWVEQLSQAADRWEARARAATWRRGVHRQPAPRGVATPK